MRGQILITVFENPIFSASWYFSNKYFPNQTFSFFSQVNLYIYTITKLLLLTTPFSSYFITVTSLTIPSETWIRAPASILAHGSILLPYLPNLCAVLRPAPLASYSFPLHSSPFLSPCIGLSLDCAAREQEISVPGASGQ